MTLWFSYKFAWPPYLLVFVANSGGYVLLILPLSSFLWRIEIIHSKVLLVAIERWEQLLVMEAQQYCVSIWWNAGIKGQNKEEVTNLMNRKK